MEIDPVGTADAANEDDASDRSAAAAHSRLNTWVAITVAILATFMGICKVKDDNIVQAMQQDQAKSIDTWAWYQAKKIRLQAAQQAVDQFEVQAVTAPQAARPLIAQKIAFYKEQANKQT